MDSRIGRESRCPYNGFEAPFDESIKAEQKKSVMAKRKLRQNTCEGCVTAPGIPSMY